MARTVLDQQLQHVNAHLLSLGNAVDELLAHVLRRPLCLDTICTEKKLLLPR